MTTTSKKQAQRSPFGPACPHCGSKDAVIDPDAPGNWWREYITYACMAIGAMAVTLHMRCNRCDGAFSSWKSVSTATHR